MKPDILKFASHRMSEGWAMYAEDHSGETTRTIECGYGSTLVGAFDDCLEKLRRKPEHQQWRDML